MQSTFYEPVQPWGGTQATQTIMVGRAGPEKLAPAGNSCLLDTVALASSDIRRDPLFSVLSLPISIFGGTKVKVYRRIDTCSMFNRPHVK